ncbi:MAG: sucrase ferredoxin [Acidimicrobiales bacterium]
MNGSLSATAAALLPTADSSPRCADHQRAMAVDPGGTAIDADVLVLVDAPLPWPAKIADHPLLAGRGPDIEIAVGRARVVAVVPPPDRSRARVRLFWREGAEVLGAQCTIDDPSELHDLFDDLERDHPQAVAAAHGGEATTTALVLVCGHGSRDQCCGTHGTRLARELAQLRPELTVERTSHLGGHRFSPTAMTLPDGRMWAHLGVDDLTAIIDRTMPATEASPRCRGWWGASMGAAQMAERAAFAAVGWSLDDHEREVQVHSTPDGDFECRVTWPAGTIEARVAVTREVPTISCRSAGGLPAKPSLEYAVVSMSDHRE